MFRPPVIGATSSMIGDAGPEQKIKNNVLREHLILTFGMYNDKKKHINFF